MTDSKILETPNPSAQAVKWLLEMEAVMDPTVQNVLVLNIKQLDDAITDVQLLFDNRKKALLIYINVRLKWWQKWGNRSQMLTEATYNIIHDALPSYRKRVITDYSIFKKALKITGAE